MSLHKAKIIVDVVVHLTKYCKLCSSGMMLSLTYYIITLLSGEQSEPHITSLIKIVVYICIEKEEDVCRID